MSNPNKDAADLTALINEKFTRRKDIAPVETGSTASRAYSAGDKFYYNNLLQKATTDIAQGATLVSGTNFENADPVTTTIQNLSTVISKNGAHNLVDISGFTLLKSTTRTKAISKNGFNNGSIPSSSVRVSFTVTDNNLAGNGSLDVKNSSSENIASLNFNGNGRFSLVFDGSQFSFFYFYIPNSEADTSTLTVSDITVTIVEDTDNTYQPWAMTNRELTEDVADIPYVALTDNGSSEYTLAEGAMWQTKGVTFLYVAVQCNTVSPSSGGNHIKISEIPSKFKKPPLILYPAIAPYRDATTGAGTQLQIATNGNIAIRGGEVGGRYSGLFSY